MEQQLQVKALPGTKADSILNDVYRHLLRGNILTTLDAVFSNRTVCLAKYISVLRSKYNVQIADRWITLSSKKHIKEYWIEGEQSTTSAK
jgi:hypothetical protein